MKRKIDTIESLLICSRRDALGGVSQTHGLSQQELARCIRAPYQRVNELIHQRRGVTPSTVLRLARFFGNSPVFWLNLQLRWELYQAQKSEVDVLKKIHPIRVGM